MGQKSGEWENLFGLDFRFCCSHWVLFSTFGSSPRALTCQRRFTRDASYDLRYMHVKRQSLSTRNFLSLSCPLFPILCSWLHCTNTSDVKRPRVVLLYPQKVMLVLTVGFLISFFATFGLMVAAICTILREYRALLTVRP